MTVIDPDVLIARPRGRHEAHGWVERTRRDGPVSISAVSVADVVGGMRSPETVEVGRLLRSLRYLRLGPGSIFSFGVVGGRAAGRRFVESVRLASHLANGVKEDLVRISVGIEDLEELLWDLDQALTAGTKEA